jgi:sugar lactone lactonase YvrE
MFCFAVADRNNERVLFFLAGSMTPSRVYGQSGSFTTNAAPSPSASSLLGPVGLALDSNDGLYISDGQNHRVLYYLSGQTTAIRVYGQAGSFTTNMLNGVPSFSNPSATNMNGPQGIALDSAGGLIVADQANNRLLYFPPGQTTATRVYGQANSFSTKLPSCSSTGLSQPYAVAFDSHDNLFVSDHVNSRVLFYPSGSTNPTRVYGQISYTVCTQYSGSAISAATLSSPLGLAVDTSGTLYVTEMSTNRLVVYSPGSNVATDVYGQPNFVSGVSGHTAETLSGVRGVAVDANGNVLVADITNNRVLVFPS